MKIELEGYSLGTSVGAVEAYGTVELPDDEAQVLIERGLAFEVRDEPDDSDGEDDEPESKPGIDDVQTAGAERQPAPPSAEHASATPSKGTVTRARQTPAQSRRK